jgi:hypothetical protein
MSDVQAGVAVDITDAGSGTLQLLVNTAAECVLESTEMQITEDDGRSDPLVGIVTLTYGVQYRTSPAVSGGNIADFLTADAKHEVTGRVPDTIPAEDTFTVRSP